MLFVMYLWAVGFGTCVLEASIGRSLWAACAVYTQLLCSVVRRVRDRTWPDPRGIWSILTGRYALLAIVLFATWVGMGMLGHALEAREKEKKSRWDRDEQGRELRKRLAQLLGVTEADLDEIAKPGDGASAEVVAKRLGERLRMGNEDRRARADAEQRVKDAGREIHNELKKLNAMVATARREAKDDRTTVELGGRRFAVEGPGGAEGLNTFLRNAEEFNKASEAKAAAAANKVRPRDPRSARERWMDRETAKHIPEFQRILEGARRRDPKAMRQLRRLNGEDVESPSESESEETASDDSSDDDDSEGIRPWDPD